MKIEAITTILIASIFISSFTLVQQQPKPWKVPVADSKLANPVKADATSIDVGKPIWFQQCSSCHGRTSKGDGKKVIQIKTPIPDLITTSVQSQTDGFLFYKISEGRSDMTAYKKNY